jgi:HSP20 family protein
MYNLTRWQRPDLSAWPTFGRLFNLRDELDRLFEGSLGDISCASSQLLGAWNPVVDLYEDKDNVFVKAELPGLKREDIQVSLHDDALSISGERKGGEKIENAEARRTERFVGRFQRTITLPSSVKADQVSAQYKDGVLTVTLPKAEEAKPRQIQINAN